MPILDGAERIISPSGFLTEGFREEGYDVNWIPNALELAKFPYKERDVPQRTIRLLWVRAFTEIYRPQWAVEIVGHLRDRGITSRLSMVGPDKGLLDATKRRASELGVAEMVDFVGAVPNGELYRYYHSHDYLLNTTKYESFGVALAEAAATGLPIVSAAVGEVAYAWNDDEDIFLVSGGSSLEFAERIGRLRRDDGAGKQYRHVSHRAWEKASKYQISNIMPKWESIIKTVRSSRCRNRSLG